MTESNIENSDIEKANFEREYSLKELLSVKNLRRLSTAINQMGLDYFDIVDLEGISLISNAKVMGSDVVATDVREIDKIALAPELEAIGFLQFEPANRKLAIPVASFILEIIQTNWRYQMASSIHLQVTQDDFDTLVEKNKQLAQSEQRCKTLSESLEDRVQAQLKVIEESQRQLYETEKMASVGQLAAGVAHEINNPIGFISSNLNTASEYLQEIKETFSPLLDGDEPQKVVANINKQEIEYLLTDFNELLQESLDGAKRVSTIVADLKAFSNVDHSEEILIDLSESVARVARVFLTSVNREIQLETDIQPVDKTYCKPGHLNQLLLNLLHNAADAIVEKGEIALTCKMENGKLLLRVSDTGKGMSEETVRKAFDPFYTTREVGGGTGLGLTVSRDIVKAHRGDISIKSQLGKGSSISIILPINKRPEKV